MSELKPCPFCGGKNVLSTELQDGLPFIAYCQCGAENEAENWNTRPIEDALLTRAEKAEEMVEWLIEAVDGYFFGVEHPASIWRKKISDLVTEWKEREENGK